MAVDAVRTDPSKDGQGSFVTRLRDGYHEVMKELAKVTWPDRPQVQQATIAILIFVLLLALLIYGLDVALNGVLVKLIPSLFAGH